MSDQDHIKKIIKKGKCWGIKKIIDLKQYYQLKGLYQFKNDDHNDHTVTVNDASEMFLKKIKKRLKKYQYTHKYRGKQITVFHHKLVDFLFENYYDRFTVNKIRS